MVSVILDTGTLLALLDPAHDQHHEAHTTIRRYVAGGHRLVVPVSVLSEALVGAFRTTPYAVRTVESFVDDLISQVHDVDRAVGGEAARLRATFDGLRLDHSLAVATAEVTGAQEILTTNPHLAQLDSRVRILGA